MEGLSKTCYCYTPDFLFLIYLIKIIIAVLAVLAAAAGGVCVYKKRNGEGIKLEADWWQAPTSW